MNTYKPTLREAISTLISSADVRASQFEMAADQRDDIEAHEIVNELYEMDEAECRDMVDIINNAIGVIRDNSPLVSTESALTAMCMQEWFAGAFKRERDHYLAEHGVSELRVNFLLTAPVLDAAWKLAHREFGYDDCFDLDFVPLFMEAAAELRVQPSGFSEYTNAILTEMGVIKS